MEEHEEQGNAEEEVQVPDDPVEDLEPGEDEADDVGGGFKQGWISK